jgi:hypothetical protein
MLGTTAMDFAKGSTHPTSYPVSEVHGFLPSVTFTPRRAVSLTGFSLNI